MIKLHITNSIKRHMPKYNRYPYCVTTDKNMDNQHYYNVSYHLTLTLPYRGGGCLLGRHPALRPQHGPSEHPRQTSRCR